MINSDRKNKLNEKAKKLGISLEDLAIKLLFEEIDKFDFREYYSKDPMGFQRIYKLDLYPISLEETERDLKI